MTLKFHLSRIPSNFSLWVHIITPVTSWKSIFRFIFGWCTVLLCGLLWILTMYFTSQSFVPWAMVEKDVNDSDKPWWYVVEHRQEATVNCSLFPVSSSVIWACIFPSVYFWFPWLCRQNTNVETVSWTQQQLVSLQSVHIVTDVDVIISKQCGGLINLGGLWQKQSSSLRPCAKPYTLSHIHNTRFNLVFHCVFCENVLEQAIFLHHITYMESLICTVSNSSKHEST